MKNTIKTIIVNTKAVANKNIATQPDQVLVGDPTDV
jgi:hypothetical protein